MKYNTISTSSLTSNGKKSNFTVYADMDIAQNKVAFTESEMASLKGELEIVQRALKLQTKRCRQLVAEYTRKLQEKEQQYQSEKTLRDSQLTKVLKALLIFESRLKQEQKFISHQLNEKDYIIKKQSSDIKKLLAGQYCKSCNQYYTSSPMMESLDSSSEYVVTDYQSSNFESLDSSSEAYATLSEKCDTESMVEENSKSEESSSKNIYQKNKNKDSLGRRSRKIPHRKSIGTYFEVLKIRNDSPLSNEDNTSADYDNLDSLPPESVTDKISLVSENIEYIFNKNREVLNDASPNVSISEGNTTVINNDLGKKEEKELNGQIDKEKVVEESTEEESPEKVSKITEAIPVFEADVETNDNWYASASDQEDEEHRDIYRNNPVLECMNQILLQNINDSLNSPPKTPNIERKSLKNKKVKFSDEEEQSQNQEIVKDKPESNHDYYETPIQKTPNFYETPQSIYSNDYEQILSKCSETFSDSPQTEKELKTSPENKVSHYYIDMENKAENETQDNGKIIRKSKILRTPPALPPKPPNLVSKYKIQNIPRKSPLTEKGSRDFEPDYCSISELNLPQNRSVSFKKINVVAEINAPTSHDVMNKLNTQSSVEKITKKPDDYDLVVVTDNVPNLVAKKGVETMNIQLAKQTPIKSEAISPKKSELDIPKLPQVSEIIIPDENEEKQQQEESRITQDNYVKNNSQILKSKTIREPRKPIVIGSSVSSIITGFNNHQILSEIKKKHERRSKVDKTMFSSFENLQSLDKQLLLTPSKEKSETPNFDGFDLSQNFEEFKLDDCEIEEYNVEEELNEEEIKTNEVQIKSNPASPTKSAYSTRVELIRATNDMMIPNLNTNSVEMLKKQLDLQKTRLSVGDMSEDTSTIRANNEPTYEHFLECTGLSSKSILTPSRLLSNHKSMLKPKDVKLRSKVKANGSLFERHSGTAIKYWSEPYI